MAMHKADYFVIAHAIKHELVYPRDSEQLRRIAIELANRLQLQNENFKREVFLKECGF
jgi:hypothetical protein